MWGGGEHHKGQRTALVRTLCSAVLPHAALALGDGRSGDMWAASRGDDEPRMRGDTSTVFSTRALVPDATYAWPLRRDPDDAGRTGLCARGDSMRATDELAVPGRALCSRALAADRRECSAGSMFAVMVALEFRKPSTIASTDCGTEPCLLRYRPYTTSRTRSLGSALVPLPVMLVLPPRLTMRRPREPVLVKLPARCRMLTVRGGVRAPTRVPRAALDVRMTVVALGDPAG